MRHLVVSLIALSLTFLSVHRLQAEEPTISLTTVKSALSNARVSAGADETKLTRSPWGPGLYRTTVNGAVLVEVFDLREGKEQVYVGSGSGAVLSANGVIITNWHVAWPQDYVVVIFYPGPLKSYEEFTEDDVWIAQVIKVSQAQDLALLQLKGKANKSRNSTVRLTPLALEEPGTIEVGQDVFAIGHPIGLLWTYTEGVISQIRPHYHWKNGSNDFVATVIQTQTAVSYGSSGGPLINRNGKLVGIISNGIPDQPGFNFAISAHEIRSFLAN